MTQTPIEWAREFAATMDDLPSLLAIRQEAETLIAGNQRIVDLLTRPQDIALFQSDIDLNTEAVRLIDARLKELGRVA